MRKKQKTKEQLRNELYGKVRDILKQYNQIEDDIADALSKYSLTRFKMEQRPRIEIIQGLHYSLTRNQRIEFYHWLLQEYQLANSGFILGFLFGLEDKEFVAEIVKEIQHQRETQKNSLVFLNEMKKNNDVTIEHRMKVRFGKYKEFRRIHVFKDEETKQSRCAHFGLIDIVTEEEFLKVPEEFKCTICLMSLIKAKGQKYTKNPLYNWNQKNDNLLIAVYLAGGHKSRVWIEIGEVLPLTIFKQRSPLMRALRRLEHFNIFESKKKKNRNYIKLLHDCVEERNDGRFVVNLDRIRNAGKKNQKN